MLPKFLLFLPLLCGAITSRAEERPNILWITSEDHGPQMGCYGDTFATTPNVDALAARGMIYRHAWSNAPVCAPARTTLLTGVYPPSSGAEHMRSMVPYPRPLYPQLMREAGYYCTNNAKEDYNVAQPENLWDESSKRAHWRKRPEGKPFMAVFNSEKSHESKIRVRPHTGVHDPAKVRVPPYHPDTPEVRQDWAQYYDVVSEADADAGMRLQELADAGLAAETIVFYYGDHGSGMPRSKRWPQNSGLHVPLVVYIPEKWKALRPPEYKAGSASDRLVSFVDFAPTLLSLAGVKPPEWMQGHAFLGEFIAPPQPYLYGFRGRMDERSDCVRSVTDGRFVYVRNFRPDKIQGQHLAYMWQTPTTRVWERMWKDGKLNEVQSAFWKPKAPEELYDLESDRDEVRNLATTAEAQATLAKFRAALRSHERRIHDVGLLPEGEMHRRTVGSTPYALSQSDPTLLSRIHEIADAASSLDPKLNTALVTSLGDPESGVRYWSVLGLLMRGRDVVQAAHAELSTRLDDPSPEVRIAAAEALGRHGSDSDLGRILPLLAQLADWSRNDVFTAISALDAIDALEEKAAPLAAAIKVLPEQGPAPHPRFKEYVPRKLAELRARFP